MRDRISRSLQENLITLVCFDDTQAKIIRNTVDVSLFEGIFREIATRVYAYIDKYSKAPQDHVADELDDILSGKDKRRSDYFRDTLASMHELHKNINVRYVVDQITTFVRQQELKSGILEAAEVLQAGADDAVERAETVLTKSLKKRAQLFDPGVVLSDVDRALLFFDRGIEALPTGIKELDWRGLGPARKTLHLMIGLAKRGKTWHLINLAKQAALARLNVCHITLEMSEPEIVQRYFQAFFAFAKRPAPYLQVSLKLDKDGRMEGMVARPTKPKISFDEDRARKVLIKQMKQMERHLKRVVVKEFPTGQLTVRGLIAYLDSLQDTINFYPDLLLVDYPELMSVSTDNYRLDIGQVYKDLRGLATERNMAVAVVSQSNRAGLSSRMVTEANAAEDFSKIATADVVLTYNQSEEERRFGLARLYVAAARRDEDKIKILLTQSYGTGQFAIQSVMLPQEYITEFDQLSQDTPPL